jgi:TetR/AcrR family transcriptional regulator, mexCD-oprJ operon repressor
VTAAWRTLGRYHELVAINARLPRAELHRRHDPIHALLEPLIERGQREGAVRSEVPAAWHLATVLAIVHAASPELHAGRLRAADAEPALVATVLGAVTATAAR